MDRDELERQAKSTLAMVGDMAANGMEWARSYKEAHRESQVGIRAWFRRMLYGWDDFCEFDVYSDRIEFADEFRKTVITSWSDKFESGWARSWLGPAIAAFGLIVILFAVCSAPGKFIGFCIVAALGWLVYPVMKGFKTITFTLAMLSMAGCCSGENIVEDLCKYVTDRQKEFSVTTEQIEEFRGSEDRTARYVAFYEAITSAGIPGDAAMFELARFAFHGQTNATNKLDKIITAYDHTHVSDVKSVGAACRNIRKTLSQGNVPDARIVRYLVGFLVATPEGRQKLEKECAAFVQMYGVISDFVMEMVTEAEDAKTIFTDGFLDEGIREECKRRRVALAPCSMMDRAFSIETFKEEMTNGVAVAQLGLEALRRMDKTKLCFSGTLFRYGKMSENARVKGVEFAKKLAERILDLQKRNVVDSLNDEEMKSKFLFVQWRIARIARMRAEQEQQQGLTERARRSLAIAEKLDECNSSLRKLKDSMAAAREKAESKMTPRERMMVALRSADFEKAHDDAKTVLGTNPKDVTANFAMGMWHYKHERWNEAEKCLLCCKDGKPRDPVIWNNLAVIYMKMGKLDAALLHARKALALNPNSENIKDTLKQIEKAMAK